MTGAAVPGGAPAPADPDRSLAADGERWAREYCRNAPMTGQTVASWALYERLTGLLAALDAARADVERLRQDLARLDWAGMLTEQTCRAGKHVTWYVDDEGAVACPWCRRDEARAEVERLAAQRATALAAVDGLESDSAAFSTVPGFRRYVVDGIREALGVTDGD